MRKTTLTLITAAALAYLACPAQHVCAQDGARMMTGNTPTATTIKGDRVEARMLRAGHIPAVMATVNGKGPYLFAVDTGTSASLIINSAFAEEHGFPVVGEVIARDGMSGAAVPLSLMEVGTLEIGGARFDGIVGSSHVLSPIATVLGADIVGIIGFGLFSDCVFTVDYPRNLLIIEQGAGLDAQDPGVVPIIAEMGIADIEIEINGRAHRTHLDTGSRGGVTVARDVFDALEFSSTPKVIGRGQTVASSFDIIQADLMGTLTIAGYPVNNPPLQTTDIMDHGNVGVQLLSSFAITFDQRNSLAQFQRPRGAGPVKIREQSKRLGIKPSILGDLVVLEMVVPGSPAEQAGLREGDRIVAINGKPIEDLRGPALGKEMQVRPTIVFVIDREGEERTIRVTM